MSWNHHWANYIQDGVINQSIAEWHSKRPERVQTCATPSSLMDCPRVIWLRYVKKLPSPIPMGWGKAQRNLHGRVFENTIVSQLKESGELLYHWKDDVEGESDKFTMGSGETRVEGTPDMLLKLPDGRVAIADAKTSMGKSFGYVATNVNQVFDDYYWYKYKLQLEAYYALCHKNKDWFDKHELPLPEVCFLFSYALDDGVNRREFIWEPESLSDVLLYARRWNTAFNSKTLPECTCKAFNGDPVKFCYYVTRQETTKTGSKIGVECCSEELNKETI